MDKEIFLSVVIPVFNVEMYLEQCINSVLEQTYSNLEVILIDDGSSDKSGLICDDYQKKYPTKVKVIHQTNLGLSSARNTGIIHSCGNYIHFVDSDDILPSADTYEYVVSSLLRDDPDVFIGKINYYDSRISTLLEEGISIGDKLLSSNTCIDDLFSLEYYFTLTSVVNKIVRRTTIIKNDLFFPDENFSDDDYWLLRFLSKVNTICFSKGSIYVVRRRENSESRINDTLKLKRRAQKLMNTSISNSSYVLENITEQKAINNAIIYYIRMYFHGIQMLRMAGVEYVNDTRIFNYLLFTGRVKFSLLFFLSKVIGKRNALFLAVEIYG